MFKSPGFRDGLGLHIHLHTTMVDNWSYIETVRIQVGKGTLEMSAHGKYFINGVPEHQVEAEQTDGKTFEYDLGGYIAQYTPPRSGENQSPFYVMTIRIGLGDGVNIAIKSFRHKKFMAIETTGVNYDTFDDGLGLAGAFGAGIMVGRDGVTVFEENDTDNFGLDWQVRAPEDPTIFQSARAPQFPTKCIVPDSKVEIVYDESGVEIPGATATKGGTGATATHRKKRRGRRRRLGQMVSEQEAEAACANWKKKDMYLCVTDVMSTGELELAEAGRYIWFA